MATATAQAPNITANATVSRTRKVEVEVFDAEGLAELTGLPLFAVRLATPPHATRIGNDYLVIAEHAERLRALASGTPAERVYRRENEIDAKRAAEWQRPIDEAIAQAEAQERARQDVIRAEQKRISDAYLARERAAMQSTAVDAVDKSKPRRNAVGDRVV